MTKTKRDELRSILERNRTWAHYFRNARVIDGELHGHTELHARDLLSLLDAADQLDRQVEERRAHVTVMQTRPRKKSTRKRAVKRRRGDIDIRILTDDGDPHLDFLAYLGRLVRPVRKEPSR